VKKMNANKKTQLEKNEGKKLIMLDENELGWFFTVKGQEFKTNRNGDGLFHKLMNGNWAQSLGTCQFSLPHDRKKAYQKIYRIFIKKNEGM